MVKPSGVRAAFHTWLSSHSSTEMICSSWILIQRMSRSSFKILILMRDFLTRDACCGVLVRDHEHQQVLNERAFINSFVEIVISMRLNCFSRKKGQAWGDWHCVLKFKAWVSMSDFFDSFQLFMDGLCRAQLELVEGSWIFWECDYLNLLCRFAGTCLIVSKHWKGQQHLRFPRPALGSSGWL